MNKNDRNTKKEKCELRENIKISLFPIGTQKPLSNLNKLTLFRDTRIFVLFLHIFECHLLRNFID